MAEDYKYILGLLKTHESRIGELEKANKPPAWKTKTCDHAMQPVKVGDLTLYATKQASIVSATPTPDVGLYLDSSWLKTTGEYNIVSFGVKGFTTKTPYPFLLVTWPDQGVLPLADFTSLIAWARKEARAGKRIEISCVGGHGRTGTMLAGIAAVELALTADEAVKLIRTTYCEEAVESLAQENLLRKLRGEPEKKSEPVKSAWFSQTVAHNAACQCEGCKRARTHDVSCMCADCKVAFPMTFGEW